MKLPYFSLVVALAVAIGFAAAGPARSAQSPSSAAIGAWLPDPEGGFDAWAKGRTVKVATPEYFRCGTAATPQPDVRDFDYAGSACPLLARATSFSYGPAGPIRGAVVYDPARRIVLFVKGCCAWRGFALVSGVAPPPVSVAQADLGGVGTARGASLGMTIAQVQKIYGAAALHDVAGRPGVAALTYTTMKGTPNDDAGDPCGQLQSFSFKDGRLVGIELLSGC